MPSEPRGVSYASQAFWEVVYGEWVTRDADGHVITWEREPECILDEKRWGLSYGRYWSCRVLIIADLPADWRESKRRRPKVWKLADDSTPMDNPVLARDSYGKWLRRYWAGNGRCWSDGQTSWSSGGCAKRWQTTVLADPRDPDAVPPDDWTPPDGDK